MITRLHFATVAAALVAASCSQPVRSGGSSGLGAQFNTLAGELEAGKVTVIEVTQVSLSKEFMVAVSPKTFNDVWDYRFTIRNELSSRGPKVASLLRSSVIESTSSPGDLRWRFSFYSADGTSMGDLYFDAWGRKGLIGSLPVTYRMDFLVRLRHALDLSFDTVP